MRSAAFIFFLLLNRLPAHAQQIKIALAKEFESNRITSISLYKYNFKNSCDQAKALSVIFNNKIDPCFDYVKSFKGQAVTSVINCLKKRTTYGSEEFACFDTDYGLVMYNAKGFITGYVNLSLFCSNLISVPKIKEQKYFASTSKISLTGFSAQGKKKLYSLLELKDERPYPSQITPWNSR